MSYGDPRATRLFQSSEGEWTSHAVAVVLVPICHRKSCSLAHRLMEVYERLSENVDVLFGMLNVPRPPCVGKLRRRGVLLAFPFITIQYSIDGEQESGALEIKGA